MTVSGNLKRIAAIIAVGVPVLCDAGRPVFQDVSLSQLTQASKLIAVVTKTSAGTVKGAYGCESLEWHLFVVAIIKTSPGADAQPGNTIGVRQNVTSYRDCVYREGWNTTGASFVATRYRPSVLDASHEDRFIIFLEPSDSGFQLTADSGFESMVKRSEVESLLNKKQTTAAQTNAPADARKAHAIEH